MMNDIKIKKFDLTTIEKKETTMRKIRKKKRKREKIEKYENSVRVLKK